MKQILSLLVIFPLLFSSCSEGYEQKVIKQMESSSDLIIDSDTISYLIEQARSHQRKAEVYKAQGNMDSAEMEARMNEIVMDIIRRKKGGYDELSNNEKISYEFFIKDYRLYCDSIGKWNGYQVFVDQKMCKAKDMEFDKIFKFNCVLILTNTQKYPFRL